MKNVIYRLKQMLFPVKWNGKEIYAKPDSIWRYIIFGQTQNLKETQ